MLIDFLFSIKFYQILRRMKYEEWLTRIILKSMCYNLHRLSMAIPCGVGVRACTAGCFV